MDGSVVIGIELEEDGFLSALTALRQTAGQTAVKALTPLLQSMSAATGAFSKNALAGESWARQITGAFSQVTAGASAMSPVMSTAGRTMAAAFINSFLAGGFSSAGTQAGSGLAMGIQTGASGLSAAASGLAAGVKAAFSGGWYSVGYQISGGIAAGVQGGSSLISRAAVTAAQTALAAAKRALGVRSPSRVFRDEVGKMIPAGIAQGISAQTPQVQAAMAQQSALLVETARRDVIPQGRRYSQGGQTPAASGTQRLYVTVDTPLYVDGREMARATANYMGSQLLWEAM